MTVFNSVLTYLSKTFKLFDIPVLGIPIYVYVLLFVFISAVANFIYGKR